MYHIYIYDYYIYYICIYIYILYICMLYIYIYTIFIYTTYIYKYIIIIIYEYSAKLDQFVLKPAAELAGLSVQIMHVLTNSCDSCTSTRMVLHP